MYLITYVLTGLAVVVGLSVAIWSFIDTRNRFYNNYLNRKQK